MSAYYAHRAVRILPAYWLVVGTYNLWLYLRGRVSLKAAAWSMSTLHYWFHISNTFNWYVSALLAFYLLSPLWVRTLRRCPRPLALTLAVLPASYGLYRLSIPLGLNYMEDFLYRLPSFALGCFAGHCLDHPLTRCHRAVWALLAACGAVTAYLLAAKLFYINYCYIIVSMLMPGCLLLGWLLDRLRWAGLNRLLRLLGENSLEIYLLNVVFTREFDALAPFLDHGPRHLFFYLSGWTLNILLGLALHRGIESAKARLIRRKAVHR